MVSWPLRLAVVALLGYAVETTAISDAPQSSRQNANARREAWLTDDEINRLPQQLRVAIERDPFTFFRRVNVVWNERVCAAFAGADQPRVRLHGDAHVEQYALTQDAYGLDDFDDTAEGPAVIDLVRFIGSLRLTAMQRRWQSGVDGPIDAFLDGYRRALADPAYAPPEPAVVQRLRLKRSPPQAAFLESVEALMEPAPASMLSAARDALATVSKHYPAYPAGYFTIKKLGALQMGVGSYTAAKFLIRIEGPSPAADDDVVLEAKEVSDLNGVACIATPNGNQAVRILIGTQQIGRLRHNILSFFQGLAAERATKREWSLRSWDRTYLEVKIQDLRSIDELSELARDAGAQLGSAGIAGRSAAANTVRQRVLETVIRLQPQVRRVATDLTNEMLAAWRR